MTLAGHRILTDLTMLSALKMAHPRLPGCDLNPVAAALIKHGRGKKKKKQAQKKTDLVKTEAEMLGDQDLLEPPEMKRGKKV